MTDGKSNTTGTGFSRRTFLKTSGLAVAGVAGVGEGAARTKVRGQVQEASAVYVGDATVTIIASNGAENPNTYQMNGTVIFREPRRGDVAESNPLNLVILGGSPDNTATPGTFVVSTATLLLGRVFQHWVYDVTSPGNFVGTLVDRHEAEIPDANVINVETLGTADPGKAMAEGTRMTGVLTETSVGIVVQGMTADQAAIFDIRVSATIT